MLEKIFEITREAGKIVRKGFSENFSVDFKSNETDLVTEIDKKSEDAIISFIKKNFPSHKILAEESGKTSGSSEYVWVIDPIDGTTNFAHGLPIFSISIGVQKNNETIYGVVYDVMRDAMYFAEKGNGSFMNEKKLAVSTNDDLRRSVLVTGFPYNIKENPHRAIERFGKFLRKSRAIRRLGSAAIDLCYVAQGVFDGFWEVHLNPWDMCAGKLIVEEAGGLVTNFKGEEMTIYSKQLLATNGKVHEEMMKVLNEN